MTGQTAALGCVASGPAAHVNIAASGREVAAGGATGTDAARLERCKRVVKVEPRHVTCDSRPGVRWQARPAIFLVAAASRQPQAGFC